MIADEVRGSPKIEELRKQPRIERQCLAWMLGYYVKILIFHDRSNWEEVDIPDRAYHCARLLNIEDDRLRRQMIDFPTLTKDQFDQIQGLGSELRAVAIGKDGKGSADYQEMMNSSTTDAPPYSAPNVDSSRELIKLIKEGLAMNPIESDSFLVPILISQLSLYPHLDFILNLGPDMLPKIISILREIPNPVIDDKVLVPLQKYVEERLNEPPGLKSSSDELLTRYSKAVEIDGLLASVETRHAKWLLEMAK